MKASPPAMLGAAAAVALAIGSTVAARAVQAADMVTNASPPLPFLATPWTGVYVGANAGGGGNTKLYEIFSDFDVYKEGVDGLVSGLFSLSKDLDTSGPRLWIAGGAGWYRYPAEKMNIQGVYSTGDLLGGYGFEGENYEINLLAGGSVENDTLSARDPENRVQGTAVGVKGRADIWINPTPQTLFYGEVEYSTAFQTWYSSAKYGFDITNGKQIFFGPEVVYFGDERHKQWRVGAHLTKIKFGNLQLDVSAGYAQDSDVGSGAYSHVELSTHF
jgi:hypothetical protein